MSHRRCLLIFLLMGLMGQLIWGQEAPRLVLPLTHKAGIKRLLLSPDGRWLASADGAGYIKSWDLQTGDVDQTLRVAGDPEVFIGWLSARELVVVANSKGWLWNVESGVLEGSFPLEGRSPQLLRGSLWTLQPKQLMCWDPRSGKSLRTVSLASELSSAQQLALLCSDERSGQLAVSTETPRAKIPAAEWVARLAQ